MTTGGFAKRTRSFRRDVTRCADLKRTATQGEFIPRDATTLYTPVAIVEKTRFVDQLNIPRSYPSKQICRFVFID